MDKIKDNMDLKWLFVSGKGGVGKTTLSSSIAIELSEYRDKVLLISLDPAHSTSDIFKQKFCINPTLINGYNNLFCIEYNFSDIDKNINNSIINNKLLDINLLIDIFNNIPGIDEAIGYIYLMNKILELELEYSIIVFDTAPTALTLKLLYYPNLFQTSYDKLFNSSLGNIFKNLLTNILPINNNGSIENKLNIIKDKINNINNKLTKFNYTQFICVTTADYLSIYEMERLIQKILLYNIECNTIFINKLLENVESKCNSCKNISIDQQYFLDILDELYSEDFNIIYIPLVEKQQKYEIIKKKLYNKVEYFN